MMQIFEKKYVVIPAYIRVVQFYAIKEKWSEKNPLFKKKCFLKLNNTLKKGMLWSAQIREVVVTKLISSRTLHFDNKLLPLNNVSFCQYFYF